MRIQQIAVFAAMALMPAALIHAQAAAAPVRPHITGISHLSVYTTDAAKTEFFYVHDLGGQKARRSAKPRRRALLLQPHSIR